MEKLYHYKVWQSDLGQYVAQRGRLSADEIRSLDGLIILDNGAEISPAAHLMLSRQVAVSAERSGAAR